MIQLPKQFRSAPFRQGDITILWLEKEELWGLKLDRKLESTDPEMEPKAVATTHWALSPSLASLTVSQISPARRCWHCSLAAWASRQVLGEGDGQASAHGGDRIWNVALGPQRRRRG